jgi:hypothetical protein
MERAWASLRLVGDCPPAVEDAGNLTGSSFKTREALAIRFWAKASVATGKETKPQAGTSSSSSSSSPPPGSRLQVCSERRI